MEVEGKGAHRGEVEEQEEWKCERCSNQHDCEISKRASVKYTCSYEPLRPIEVLMDLFMGWFQNRAARIILQ